MQAALVLTAQEGSTAHDKPVPPIVGDQEPFERPSRHGPRCRTPVVSICEGSPGHTSIDRRRHARNAVPASSSSALASGWRSGFNYGRKQASSSPSRLNPHSGDPRPAVPCNRVSTTPPDGDCQVARSQQASQKPLYCATYPEWLSRATSLSTTAGPDAGFAGALRLRRRTRHRAIRTEYAAIATLRSQLDTAARAFVNDLARVCRHALSLRSAAFGAGHDCLIDHLFSLP